MKKNYQIGTVFKGIAAFIIAVFCAILIYVINQDKTSNYIPPEKQKHENSAFEMNEKFLPRKMKKTDGAVAVLFKSKNRNSRENYWQIFDGNCNNIQTLKEMDFGEIMDVDKIGETTYLLNKKGGINHLLQMKNQGKWTPLKIPKLLSQGSLKIRVQEDKVFLFSEEHIGILERSSGKWTTNPILPFPWKKYFDQCEGWKNIEESMFFVLSEDKIYSLVDCGEWGGRYMEIILENGEYRWKHILEDEKSSGYSTYGIEKDIHDNIYISSYHYYTDSNEKTISRVLKTRKIMSNGIEILFESKEDIGIIGIIDKFGMDEFGSFYFLRRTGEIVKYRNESFEEILKLRHYRDGKEKTIFPWSIELLSENRIFVSTKDYGLLCYKKQDDAYVFDKQY